MKADRAMRSALVILFCTKAFAQIDHALDGVESRLPHQRRKVAGCQTFETPKVRRMVVKRQTQLGAGISQQQQNLGGLEKSECHLQVEPAKARFVQPIQQVGGRHEDAVVERLHLLQQFVDLRHLPVPVGIAARCEKAVGFVDDQYGALMAGGLEGFCDELLGLPNEASEQLSARLEQRRFAQHVGDVLGQRGLAGTGGP